MNNCSFKIVYKDSDLIQLKIVASNDYVTVKQYCYVDNTMINRSCAEATGYIMNPNVQKYIEYGSKQGNYTPSFSMTLLPMDYDGHLKIEMDMEIDDNDSRAHRCKFFVNTELGAFERFFNQLSELQDKNVGFSVCLYGE